MRWSLFYLCTFLLAASLLEVIVCAPVEAVDLEPRATIKAKTPIANRRSERMKAKGLIETRKGYPHAKAKAKARRVKGTSPKASNFKKSSQTYRNAALKNPHVSRGKLVKIKTPQTTSRGWHNDPPLLAQWNAESHDVAMQPLPDSDSD